MSSQPISAPALPEKVTWSLAGSIVATAILSFLGLFLETVVGILFPDLMADFGIEMSTVQWMTSGYLLVVSVIMPLSGYLQRRFTARSIFSVAAVTILVGAVIAAVAPSFGALLCGRLLQGVGTGLATPLMFTIILVQSPRRILGQLMGVGALVLGAAPAVGPTVGGILGTVSSWRVVFWIVVPLVVAALVIGWLSIEQVRPTQPIPLSVGQLALMAVAFVGIILGIERFGAVLAAGSATTGQVGLAAVLLLGGVAAGVGFVVTNRRSAAPIIRLQVLASAVYRRALVAFALFQFAALGLGYLLPNVAQLGLGISSLEAGLVVLPGALLGAVFAPLGGMILDRLGATRPILAGSSIALVGILVMGFLGTNLTPVLMGVGYFVFMFGFGLTYTNTQTFGMGHVSGELTADGTALMNTVQQFLGAMSMTVLSTIIAMSQSGLVVGSAEFTSSTMTGATISLLVVAVMVTGALVAQVLAVRADGHQTRPEQVVEPDRVAQVVGA